MEDPCSWDDLPTTRLLSLHEGGERRALDVLFRRHYADVTHCVCAKAGLARHPRFEPADIVQQTFLQAYEAIDRYEHRPEASFLDWIRSIATNALRDEQRRHSRQRRDVARELASLDEPSGAAADAASGSSGDDPVLAASRREEATQLEACLEELSPEHRDVLRQHYLQGEPWQMVAERTGRTTRSVAKLAGVARRALKRSLSRRGLALAS